ncbi:hypothetical protein NHX12_005286 [Muraenolepis orangiensis]|uniref:Transmembrane protein 39A n=1 Tax=Muraenolepis orangiensis TaxID=630683 RepID=A0A9Q0ICT9_9TELE|nr:hypothetical protein NHX12_005286 [Muraenolepis orangiensis]
MPGGRRGPSRQQLSRSALPSLQTLVGANLKPVRHSKIPELPLDSSLLFELLLFLYLLVALFVQYINIYRTVWWYPYSHPAASTSLNFHLMDYHLAIFITVMLARRLVWTIVSERGTGSLVRSALLITARLFLLTLCGWVLCWTLVNLCRNHSVLNLLFLGYPHAAAAAVVTSDCGYHGDQGQQGDFVAAAAAGEAPFFRPRDFLFLLRENLRQQFASPPLAPTHTCPPHTHSHTAELIRGEVEELKEDFNRRIKEVLFNSLFSAYYVAFLPLCFVKSTQYYDMRWSCEHLIMVWINAFVMLMSQLLPPSYCDLLHRSAGHLGRWQKLEHGSYSNAPQHVWSDSTIWPQGVLVRHSRSLYKAMGTYNVALPSDISHSRFYFLFHKPLRILNLLIWIESSVVLYQLYSLLRSERWNHTLSLGLILFCNYYVLFKLLRDRIVLGKAYSFPSCSSTSSSPCSSSSSSSNGLGLKSQ